MHWASESCGSVSGIRDSCFTISLRFNTFISRPSCLKTCLRVRRHMVSKKKHLSLNKKKIQISRHGKKNGKTQTCAVAIAYMYSEQKNFTVENNIQRYTNNSQYNKEHAMHRLHCVRTKQNSDMIIHFQLPGYMIYSHQRAHMKAVTPFTRDSDDARKKDNFHGSDLICFAQCHDAVVLSLS